MAKDIYILSHVTEGKNYSLKSASLSHKEELTTELYHKAELTTEQIPSYMINDILSSKTW